MMLIERKNKRTGGDDGHKSNEAGGETVKERQ